MGDRRLFVAVRPPVRAVTELEDFIEAAGFNAAGVRLVRPENWHITLSFMPAVTTSQAEGLHDALLRLCSVTPPMNLVLCRAGTFARSGHATPIWIGVDGEVEALAVLAAGCRAAGHLSGTRVDSPKAYRPHLTLARRRPPEHATLWMERLDQFHGTGWTVQEIVLVESALQGRGHPPRHTVIGRYHLTG